MKFLVERTTGLVSGGFNALPDVFPISGAYVMDVPFDDFSFDPSIPTVSSLVTQKYNRLDSYVRTLFTYEPLVISGMRVYTEFLSSTAVNPSYSSLYSTGPDRRYALRPTGYMAVGSSASFFTFNSPPVNLYCSFLGYFESLSSSSLLPYGAPDHYVDTDFDRSADVTVQILDSTGVALQTMSYGQNTASGALAAYTGDFYALITNNSGRNMILSDFSLYWSY